jgi:hypothetical protein
MSQLLFPGIACIERPTARNEGRFGHSITGPDYLKKSFIMVEFQHPTIAVLIALIGSGGVVLNAGVAFSCHKEGT